MEVGDHMDDVAVALEDLAPYDPADLAAGVGALQVWPHNAKSLLRLERAAAIVAGLQPHTGPRMSPRRWRHLLNEPPIADIQTVRAEDPFEEPYVSSIAFFGGSHLALPGLMSDGVAIVSRLLDTVFHRLAGDDAGAFQRQVFEAAIPMLRLQDAVARRAGLRRNAEPHSDGVDVPQGPTFSHLKNAVRFTTQDLESVVGSKRLDAIAPFVRPAGSLQDPLGRSDEPTDPRMIQTPLLSTGDEFVVVLPTAICAALRLRIVMLAAEHDQTRALAGGYREAVAAEIARALITLSHEPVQLENLTRLDGCRELFFEFDQKLCHVAIATDSLSGYGPEDAYGMWVPDLRMEDFEPHLAGTRAIVRSSGQYQEVLHLLVLDGAGRSVVGGLSAEAVDADSRLLTFTASDLSVVAYLEQDDILALWKFADAADRLRDHTQVLAWSTLDEFTFYRGHEYSYYAGDNARPTLMAFESDTALDLRMRAAVEVDHHAVVSPEGTVIAVLRRWPGTSIPIYAADPLAGQVRLVLPDPKPNLWVQLKGHEVEHGIELCDMVVYWLWQCLPSLAPLLEELAATREHVVWNVRLASRPGQESDNEETEQARPWFEISPNGEGFDVEFLEATSQAMAGPDNSGERALLGALLGALVSDAPGGHSLEPADIVEVHAPFGPKRMVTTLSPADNPMVGATEVPPARVVHRADTAVVLDAIGEWLTERYGLSLGPIPSDRRTEGLNAVVKSLFDSLEVAVSELSSDGLVDFLVAHNESLLRSQALYRLNLPTRIACFGAGSDLPTEIEQELRDATSAAICSRFLIEYVAAMPPSGHKTVNLDLYDRLMALAVEIVNKGILSDAVNYGLSDTELAVLDSGRLGIDRDDRFGQAIEVMSGINAATAIESAHVHYASHWPISEDEPQTPEYLEDLERAAVAEFGFTFHELANAIGALIEAGEVRAEPATMWLHDVRAILMGSAGLSGERTDAILAALTLGPRDRFVPAESPPDAYPWRFNRALSYLRRPLILTEEDGRTEVHWGSRNLYQSGRYLMDLCTSARLKATSEAMSQFLGSVRSAETDAFNDAVADHLRDQGCEVRPRVTKIGNLPIVRDNGEDLGDIDVLAADARRKILWAVEVKDFEVARTPAELKNEVQKLTDGEQSAAARHAERLAWLHRHLAPAIEWLKLDASRRWKVRGLIVVSRDLLGPHLHDRLDIPVVSYRDLRDGSWG